MPFGLTYLFKFYQWFAFLMSIITTNLSTVKILYYVYYILPIIINCVIIIYYVPLLLYLYK